MKESDARVGEDSSGDLDARARRMGSIITLKDTEPKESKKTTIIFTPEGQRDVGYLTEAQGISKTEAIHRAMRLNAELIAWCADGGEIILRQAEVEVPVIFNNRRDSDSV